jgi:uncharacterized protein (TIGR03067 family)
MPSVTRFLALALFIIPAIFIGCAHSGNTTGSGLASFQGSWLPVTAELGGKPFPEQVRKTISLRVEGDKYIVTVGPAVDKGTLHADPAAHPQALDIVGTDGPNKGRTILAIFEHQGDMVRICYDLSGGARPSEFVSKEGTQLFLVSYKKQ